MILQLFRSLSSVSAADLGENLLGMLDANALVRDQACHHGVDLALLRSGGGSDVAGVQPHVSALDTLTGQNADSSQVLRQAVTGQLPDVSYQGVHRQRVFADRGLAVDLTPFIKAEKGWAGMGYDQALLSLGQVKGQQVGIGFALSTPVIYYNADLMRKASKWADWLEARFVTLDVTKAGATPSTPSQPATVAQRATPAARPAPAPQQAAPAAAAARSVSVAGYVPRTVSFNTSREGSAE